MTESEMPSESDEQAERQALDDLDVGEDADQVIGGRISCPCEGGEIHRQL